ncbi:hypothetical protein RSSM_05091 [Rhodopirellula sallentina SM41]|uniref:Uncharacterized protein n=1 Tax=Rhodopirellula sallentina SM41 TaxID=1263870 RepID=M5TWC4_9BACT|nr:hypothetical protein RSSM_05091 [Rhodopirellula sallentina SM41]
MRHRRFLHDVSTRRSDACGSNSAVIELSRMNCVDSVGQWQHTCSRCLLDTFSMHAARLFAFHSPRFLIALRRGAEHALFYYEE